MPAERRRVLYEGRVQGVGFRMTTNRLAHGFAVAGFVRNLPDGRVELVAQGEPAVVASFLGAVGREFGDMIHHVESQHLPPDPAAPAGFSIHYQGGVAS